MKKKPNKEKDQKPVFHSDLEGFDIKVNAFGEIQSSFTIDKLNTFLNKEVVDKKLSDQKIDNALSEEE